MTALAIAAFLLLSVGVNRAAHPSRTHILCSGKESGDWTYTPGDTVVVDPPTCRNFEMGYEKPGPLLFR